MKNDFVVFSSPTRNVLWGKYMYILEKSKLYSQSLVLQWIDGNVIETNKTATKNSQGKFIIM